MVTPAEVEAIVARVLASSSPARCRAEYPHEGQLRYVRGPTPYYICACGARYRKDGQGGLADWRES